MALSMPRPIALAHGVYHLNIRVPSDLADKAKGTVVTLPIEEARATVRVGDKVIVSLRTKDPAVAKARFAEAEQALARHWIAIRNGPVQLPHKQCVALAGDVYRRWVETYESDPAMSAERFAADMRQMDGEVEAWRYDPSDGAGEIAPASAELLARLAQPNGVYLLAFELNRDINVYGVSATVENALEVLFGNDADRVCRERNLILDVPTRRLLLQEVARAVRFAAEKYLRTLEGDFSPDPAANRFPVYEAPKTIAEPAPAQHRRVETVGDLFDKWKAYAADKVAASTVRRYGPSLASLDRWAKGRDWRHLTDEDIFAWATHRRDQEGISATTVNRNDLVAVSSVFVWPMTLEGGKRSVSNPAAALRLRESKKITTREKAFRIDEIRSILLTTRAVTADRLYPRASASRRWCPWICAYTGARIQEPLWLEKQNIRREGDIWVIDFHQTKDGFARTVPIHRELIREGLLEFVTQAPPGYLFVGDRPQKKGTSRSVQELRAAELASWIRSKVDLDKALSPNHAWRHTWITYAEAAGIPKRFSNRITGHNANRDASDGYVAPLISALAVEMAKFPAYPLE